MKQVFKDPTSRAQLPKHGFPMEQSKKITASFGQLLPVYYDILNAGEKIRFKTKWFTRTQPMSTAAMVRVREHVEYFFVPFEQLYSLFGSFRYGILDIHSSLFDKSLIRDRIPTVRFQDMFNYISSHNSDICGNLSRNYDSRNDLVFDSLWNGAYRLFDLLQYGTDMFWFSSIPSTLAISPYMLAAYQKIFNDVYRLDDYTEPLPDGFNMDSGYQGTWSPNMLNLLSLRYRPFYKDYFTSSSPSPLVNGTSMLGQSDQTNILARVNQWLSSGSYALTDVSGVQSSTPDFSFGNIQVSSGNTQIVGHDEVYYTKAAVSAPQLRTMFAIEKLAEITGRAGKHYDAQTLAHFGFEVPQGISGEVIRLGGQSQTLQIGEVVGTATTESSVLGEIAGKAYSITEHADDNEFTAPADGIFMAIYSAVPELTYLSRLDKLNVKFKREDFYLPEFDKLGKQPLFAYEYWGIYMNLAARSRVSAWQYRYLESKTKYNVATSAFADDCPFADWTLHYDVNDSGFDLDQVSLYCNPRILDDIFLVNYDNLPDWPYNSSSEQDPVTLAKLATACYSTDPLIIDFDFDVSKASYMSPYGIPNL